LIAVLGGLGAAAAWAVSTLCSSRSSRMIDPRSVVAWVMLVGLLICAPLAAASGVPAALDGSAGGWLLLSGAGNVFGLLMAYRALRIGKVALVAPLLSTEGAVAALFALLAGERLRAVVAAALALAAVGVCLAVMPASDREPASRQSHPEAVAFAMLAALSFGASLYATARAGASLPVAWVVLSARVIGVVAFTLPLSATRRLRLTRDAFPLVVGAGICEVVGFFSYTAGARHGVAVAAVLSSQFAAIAALVAYLLFGERLGPVQLAGVGTVLVAVSLLSGVSA
jgi:drug/metabolite transporter (DMT)-like permease